MLFFLCVVLITIGAIVGRVTEKRLGIERTWIFRPINKFHMWLEIFLSAIIIVVIPLVIGFENLNMLLYIFGSLSALFLIRTFLERKLDRESKRYIITFIDFCTFVSLVIVSLIFFTGNDIEYTHNAIVFVEEETVTEFMEIDIVGELEPTLFGDSFV
ncbi:DUF4181 domain-containing protein, partial [Evansella sp. AB-rgal1]|uniref:DUF4181 domain-containing protein n=1 Tax=Evansella sp. AB-rgal1 TaxID=3242696 RepID=UPI00359E13A1